MRMDGVRLMSDGADTLVKIGNRTECALLELCSHLGANYSRIRSEQQVVRRFPFSSDRKRMSTLAFNPGDRCGMPSVV